MREKDVFPGVSVGMATLLMVFVLLCLTVFSVLSVVSALADQRLALSAARSTDAYYAADAQAQELLAQIDRRLAVLARQCPDEASYMSGYPQALADLRWLEYDRQEGGGEPYPTLRFQLPVDDHQALRVSLSALYPDAQGNRYLIRGWLLVNTGEWTASDDVLNLWDGS
jgi:hypothetical protein